MKNCENCKHQFCTPSRENHCGMCLSRRGREGWRPMGLITRLRRWLRGLV